MTTRRIDRMAPAGFTLLELMITLVIIAIIAAIAIPSWEKSVQRSDRSDAKTTLTTDAQILERCYTQYFSYTPGAGNTCPAMITTTQNGYYTITAPTLAASAYSLKAVAIAGPPKNDKDCKTFVLDSTGQKTAYNSASQTSADINAACWGY